MAPNRKRVVGVNRAGRAGRLMGIVAFAAVLVLTGCSSDGGTSDTATRAESKVDSALAATAAGRTIIDVRTPEEYSSGHIRDAVNVDVSSPTFEARLSELARDGTYLVYCRSGNRSAAAVSAMRQLGFTDVVDGGAMATLVDAGLPTD